jgi:hypothetical protein
MVYTFRQAALYRAGQYAAESRAGQYRAVLEVLARFGQCRETRRVNYPPPRRRLPRLPPEPVS